MLGIIKNMLVTSVVKINRCRKLVSHFHKSRVDNDEFKKSQLTFSNIPKHKLIHDVTTHWNTTYNMI